MSIISASFSWDGPAQNIGWCENGIRHRGYPRPKASWSHAKWSGTWKKRWCSRSSLSSDVSTQTNSMPRPKPNR
ncbi:MAG TPA: hypothetical protein VFQ19_17075 [Nocardioidaceae bacterium]|nr:hypothetical protein [Nocardioidaceae bacterium]